MIERLKGYRELYSLKQMEHQDGSKVKNPFIEITIDSEIAYASGLPAESQEDYLLDRLVTLEASRKIINDTLDFSKVENGAEFGSGAYGVFHNYFLPNKNGNWTQFDINPGYVEHNRKRSKGLFRKPPNIEVGNIYKMPLEDSSVDAIAGLSAWDSIYFYEKAIGEVKRCLRPGGRFLHCQDLHPSEMPLVMTEAKKRMERGMGSDVPCEFTRINVSDVPFIIELKPYLISIDSLDYGFARLGEYLTKHLAGLFSDAGFRIELADELQREALVERHEFNKELKKNFGGVHKGKENVFVTAYGKKEGKYDPSIPEGCIKQLSAMDVLIAQKP